MVSHSSGLKKPRPVRGKKVISPKYILLFASYNEVLIDDIYNYFLEIKLKQYSNNLTSIQENLSLLYFVLFCGVCFVKFPEAIKPQLKEMIDNIDVDNIILSLKNEAMNKFDYGIFVKPLWLLGKNNFPKFFCIYRHFFKHFF